MQEQLSIFDWMPECQKVSDIDDITEEEAARIVGERLGLKFIYNKKYHEYQANVGKLRLGMNYDHFDLDDNTDLFLGTRYDYGTSGGACPCSGIDDAIKYFERKIREWGKKSN